MLFSVLGVGVADVGGHKVAAVFVKGILRCIAEHVVVIGLGNDGFRRTGTEGADSDTVFFALVQQPVAGDGGIVEPHADQALIDTAAAALDPDVLMLDDIGETVQFALIHQLLDKLGVHQADAAALPVDPFLLLKDDGLHIVVRQRCCGRTARVAGADNHDFGGENLCSICLGVVVGIGEETGLFAGIIPVEPGGLRGGGIESDAGQRKSCGTCYRTLQEVATRDFVCHFFLLLFCIFITGKAVFAR